MDQSIIAGTINTIVGISRVNNWNRLETLHWALVTIDLPRMFLNTYYPHTAVVLRDHLLAQLSNDFGRLIEQCLTQNQFITPKRGRDESFVSDSSTDSRRDAPVEDSPS